MKKGAVELEHANESDEEIFEDDQSVDEKSANGATSSAEQRPKSKYKRQEMQIIPEYWDDLDP